jgi:integrase
VFVTDHGTPLEPRNVNRSLSDLCARAGVARRGVHSLRHTFATLALDNGVPLAVISETLGHSSIRVTADVYCHVTPRATREAAATLAVVLGLGAERAAQAGVR